MNITLIKPDISLKTTYLKGLKELQDEGLSWLMSLDIVELENDFQGFVDKLLQAAYLRTAVLVPETILWAVDEKNNYVGRISIRHELNKALRIMGGHIGYDTVPSYRKLGVASKMLKLSLPIARSLGIKEVLITCDDNNQASIKVIEKNGGVFEKKTAIERDKSEKRYYWIKL